MAETWVQMEAEHPGIKDKMTEMMKKLGQRFPAKPHPNEENKA
mgnify:CR=1 FL=1